ncbi:hypothetical protein Purlil1_12826 [Purpureocillium lilacinum]|uniref:Transposase n=1 Tax=Purpureocillium lilacinum TaxID=33203 RepID=A0ABR0BFQ3_PURLI|nr:hypothetical protein Purlil1_12826 [Purpureocillium lilacinum]
MSRLTRRATRSLASMFAPYVSGAAGARWSYIVAEMRRTPGKVPSAQCREVVMCKVCTALARQRHGRPLKRGLGNVEVPTGTHAANRPRGWVAAASLAQPGRGALAASSGNGRPVRPDQVLGSARLQTCFWAQCPAAAGSQGRNVVETGEAGRSAVQRKRTRPAGDEGPLAKRTRTRERKAWTVDDQAEALASVVCHLEDQHELTERLTRAQTWCGPIPHGKKVSTTRRRYRSKHANEPSRSREHCVGGLGAETATRAGPLPIHVPALFPLPRGHLPGVRTAPEPWKSVSGKPASPPARLRAYVSGGA